MIKAVPQPEASVLDVYESKNKGFFYVKSLKFQDLLVTEARFTRINARVKWEKNRYENIVQTLMFRFKSFYWLGCMK